jgi:tRNA modification GTPase
MRQNDTDTIAAIATPLGEGGISVIRVSGQDALAVADRGFRSSKRLSSVQSHTAHFGRFVSPSGDVLDEVVALVFRQPNSYTGENVVEISCHGGVFVTRRILEALVDYGARLAEPGEFTKRAFLNGKIDLSQAEAVADLIHAGSELALRSSLEQLQGRLSEQVNKLRNQIIDVAGLLELELDFAEENLEFVDKKKLAQQLDSIINDLRQLADSFESGRVYREGVKVVLIGSPNVGKSSILNSLLNSNRAIVTEIPGTTRDTIEESLSIDGLLFRIVDTAGIRETSDPIEQEGVRRTESQIENSDLLLFVFDSSRQALKEEIDKFKGLCGKRGSSRGLIVINKIDLPERLNIEALEEIRFHKSMPVVRVSARTGEGMEELKKKMVGTVLSKKSLELGKSVTVTNIRHHKALTQAASSLELSLQSLNNGMSGELVAVDMRAALDRLGEITGAVTTDDILNSIFSKFCIGK